jgi:hypothetical protein
MDVGGWLRSLGLDKYEAAFRENGIDEQVLRHVTAEDLREIGVATVGDRRKLLAAIAELAAPSPSTEPRPPPSPASRPKTPEVSAERRPITVMFCDLVGSTSLAAKLDAEDWRNLVNAYLDEATKAVTGLSGHVLKRLGDGLMALFGYPQAQENDAERAVRAALAIQRALAEITSVLMPWSLGNLAPSRGPSDPGGPGHAPQGSKSRSPKVPRVVVAMMRHCCPRYRRYALTARLTSGRARGILITPLRSASRSYLSGAGDSLRRGLRHLRVLSRRNPDSLEQMTLKRRAKI